MSIRDIIEAATPGPWWTAGGVVSADNKYVTSSDPYVFQVPIDPSWDNATFAATFDPEHVALMEAVCEAAAGYIEDRSWCVTILANAAYYLAAYRKERGL